MDGQGRVVDRRSSPLGVLRVAPGGFAAVLRGLVADWLAEGETEILMCGMVGSRSGWVEAGYVACPARPSDVVNAAVEVVFKGARAMILPGVEGLGPEGTPEVMRGEETGTIGVLAGIGGDGLVCLPGTHSKWVTVRDGAIESFVTHMTGEVFAALREHTILAQLMERGAEMGKGYEMAAFAEGVGRSGGEGGLLHHLFSVRTLVLKGWMKSDAASAYLSGLLIGHEVRSAKVAGRRVHLVGDGELCRLYAEAIGLCGGAAQTEDGDAAAHGMALLAGLLPSRTGVQGRSMA